MLLSRRNKMMTQNAPPEKIIQRGVNYRHL